MDDKLVRIDGVKWHRYKKERASGVTKDEVEAICPEHSMKLTPTSSEHHIKINGQSTLSWSDGQYLYCDEGHMITMPRIYSEERQYVVKRLDAINFSKMNVINLDDEATPIAKEKLVDETDRYFITSQLMKSKRGLQLVVYAGEKGATKKTQIFIDPKAKRLSFDQKDLNPTDIFVSLNATFMDGSATAMNAPSEK